MRAPGLRARYHPAAPLPVHRRVLAIKARSSHAFERRHRAFGGEATPKTRETRRPDRLGLKGAAPRRPRCGRCYELGAGLVLLLDLLLVQVLLLPVFVPEFVLVAGIPALPAHSLALVAARHAVRHPLLSL